MIVSTRDQTTRTLNELAAGDATAVDRLMPLVYEELRRLAARYFRREAPGGTLQPTALVNEAYLRLVDQYRVDWRGRTHFLAVGARLMRRILVDQARRRGRKKRGGQRRRVALDEDLVLSASRHEDLLDLDDVLEKLAALDARQARIVELRFFGGLNVAQVAEVLGVSKRTVESEWTMVRAWLRRELAGEAAS